MNDYSEAPEVAFLTVMADEITDASNKKQVI